MMSIPHASQPVYTAGADLKEATSAMILLHGRGATAQDILSLSAEFNFPGLAFLAPQASDYTWYPNRFILPVDQNEPHLSSALGLIAEIIKHVQNTIPLDHIFIGGFSQGACLAAEYVIRNPRRYAGLLAFSGGFIGPLNIPREPEGNFDGMPAFLGCSDVDPHIPLQRVKETTAMLQAMQAKVTERIYPQMEHTIIEDEIREARKIIEANL
jgi:predicted esterase